MSNSKLVFALHPNWEAVPNAEMPTFMRKWRMNTNALQVSCLSWQHCEAAEIDPAIVVAQWVERMGAQQVTPLASPSPARMATSRFTRAEFPHCQFWSIVEASNLINATFICDAVPTSEELNEVEAMVASLGIREQPKKKWLWF